MLSSEIKWNDLSSLSSLIFTCYHLSHLFSSIYTLESPLTIFQSEFSFFKISWQNILSSASSSPTQDGLSYRFTLPRWLYCNFNSLSDKNSWNLVLKCDFAFYFSRGKYRKTSIFWWDLKNFSGPKINYLLETFKKNFFCQKSTKV